MNFDCWASGTWAAGSWVVGSWCPGAEQAASRHGPARPIPVFEDLDDDALAILLITEMMLHE
jgi:hypothetical protein